MVEKRIIEVVGAIIKDGDRYLVGQRAANKSQGGLWEFMGGKIEPGETPEQALAAWAAEREAGVCRRTPHRLELPRRRAA